MSMLLSLELYQAQSLQKNNCASNEKINVIYVTDDGNFGLIET